MSPAVMEVEQSYSHVSSITRMRRGFGPERCGAERSIPILWQEGGQCLGKLCAGIIFLYLSNGCPLLQSARCLPAQGAVLHLWSVVSLR